MFPGFSHFRSGATILKKILSPLVSRRNCTRLAWEVSVALVRTVLAVMSLEEETNQRSELAVEFCAKVEREDFAVLFKSVSPLASMRV